MSIHSTDESPEVQGLLRLFRTSRPIRSKQRTLQGQVALAPGQVGVCIGGEPGLIPASLTTRGKWSFVILREDQREVFQQFVSGRPVHVLDRNRGLDFPDSSLDYVVIIDALEYVEDDFAFIQECHRVLKERGSLVIAAAHDKKGMLGPFRKMAGLEHGASTPIRPGYTQKMLYDLLKDGYDITEYHHYSKFWEQLGDLIQQIAAGLFAGRSSEVPSARLIHRIGSIRSVTGILTLPLILLDKVIGWGAGYQLVAHAKARIWQKRREVKIRDGRSIAEAALQTKIGSAIEM